MESSSTPSFPLCPCNDCVCVPVCRQKGYYPLVQQCKLILHILYTSNYSDAGSRSVYFNKMIYKVNDALNPRYWRISETSINNKEPEIVGMNLKELGYNHDILP